jgi:hypothetical protein
LRYRVVDYIFGTAYYGHPVISLYICYKILGKDNKKLIPNLLLPVISWGIIALPAMTFAVAVSVEVSSYFWPLYFLSKNKKYERGHFILYVILLVFLATSYSTAAILIPILLFSWWKRSLSEADKARAYIHLGITFIALIYIIFNLFFFINPYDRKMGAEAFFNIFEWDLKYIYFGAMMFLLHNSICTVWNNKITRRVGEVLVIGVSLFSFYIIYHYTPIELVHESFFLRALVVPLLFVLAFQKEIEEQFFKKNNFKYNWLLIYFALFPSVAHDLKTSHTWGERY